MMRSLKVQFLTLAILQLLRLSKIEVGKPTAPGQGSYLSVSHPAVLSKENSLSARCLEQ